jgi:hypothetical protein
VCIHAWHDLSDRLPWLAAIRPSRRRTLPPRTQRPRHLPPRTHSAHSYAKMHCHGSQVIHVPAPGGSRAGAIARQGHPAWWCCAGAKCTVHTVQYTVLYTQYSTQYCTFGTCAGGWALRRGGGEVVAGLCSAPRGEPADAQAIRNQNTNSEHTSTPILFRISR